MNGTVIGWAMGALTGLALTGLAYAVVIWRVGTAADCCPHAEAG